MKSKKKKLKGYWTKNEYSKFIATIPIGSKIPKSCGVVCTVDGDTYYDVHDKLWKWNTEIGKYYIYIEE